MFPLVKNDSTHKGYFSANSIVFVGFFIANILNYVFTFAMGRALTVSSFGEITALLGLLVILNVPAIAITTFIAQQVSSFKAKNEISAIKKIISLFKKYTLLLGLGAWSFFVFCIPMLSEYLNGVSYISLGVFSLTLPIVLVLSVSVGILQGLQNFYIFSLQNILGTLIKLILALFFVYLGFSVGGVMLALLFSFAFSYLYASRRASKLMKELPQSLSDNLLDISGVYSSTFLIFTAVLFLAILLNIDVVIAKHYLLPDTAGQYAALSTIGKILVYGVGSFHTVLLPVVSAAHSSRENSTQSYLKSPLLVISGISIVVIFVFSLFPELVIRTLFGIKYLSIAPYLGLFMISMFFVSLIILFVSYFIAMQNKSFLYFLVGGVVLQIILFHFYHDSIFDITFAFVLSSGVLASTMYLKYICCYTSVQSYV